jgi:hypothetical protein
MPHHPGRWRQPAIVVLIAVALAAVFLAYLDPHFAFDLASRAWSCF